MSSESTSQSWLPQPRLSNSFPEQDDADRDDAETASQRSISLDSMDSPRNPFKSIPLSSQNSAIFSKRESNPYTLDTDLSSENDDMSLYTNDIGTHETPDTSAAPSVSGRESPSVYDAELSPSKFKGFPPSILRDSTPQAAIFNILPATLLDESKPSPLSHKSFFPPALVDTSPGTRQTPSELVSRNVKRRPVPTESLSLSPKPSSARKHPSLSPIPDAILPHLKPDELPSSNYNDTKVSPQPTYPPVHPIIEPESIHSFASSSPYPKKIRPESMLLDAPDGPIVLGLALVNFDHLVGPKIEYSRGDILEDREISNLLPFLALPDGSHLSVEDYSYFHLVPSRPNPTTIFCISCNRKIVSDSLPADGQDVTRSTVQKAIVVLASKPVFGPIRDKLGVVTRALLNQKDFTETDILQDFSASLEPSLRTQLTESGLYMGTSIRELIHTFRQRTLVLLKALMLQKRIMFYGQTVERLCIYQYSLVSLVPGLLQTLDDCGSPPLAVRAPTLSRPTSLRTSDHKSMLAYLGLPLDIFGKDAFFQPYLPLQQLDILRETKSWLCGSTNPIVPQQREYDLLVNIESGTIEFRDAAVERSARLTAADRKWMDDIVRDVNAGWNDNDPTRPSNMHFKGSDDYLRTKFEEYVSAALASVKYRDFVAKGEGNDIGGSASVGNVNSAEDFNPLWIHEFKKTNAHEVWERTTDPLLFDIVEPRHPCNEKPSVVADLGLRLQEGIQELKLDQQLAPTREVISRSFNTSSTNFLKAMEGVGRWARSATSSTTSLNEALPPSTSTSSTPPVETRKAVGVPKERADIYTPKPTFSPLRQLSLQRSARPSPDVATAESKTTWGSIGTFWTTTLSLPRSSSKNTGAVATVANTVVPVPVTNSDEVSSPFADDFKSLDDHSTKATPVVTAVAV